MGIICLADAPLEVPLDQGGTGLIGGSPDKVMLPEKSGLRYNCVLIRMAAIDETEMRELVLDAWRMVVPKKVAAAYSEGRRKIRDASLGRGA
jgi:hypothetical protein